LKVFYNNLLGIKNNKYYLYKHPSYTSCFGSIEIHSAIFLSFLPFSLHCAFGHHHSYHCRFINFSTTSGCLNSSPTGHQATAATLSLFSFQPFSFLYKPFSSSSISRIRPPFPDPTPVEQPAEPPHHVRDSHTRQLSPPFFTSSSLSWLLHAKFISACSD